MNDDDLPFSRDELENLARHHETPFFVIDVPTIRDRIERVRRAFSFPVSVLFAVKANPNPVLLSALRDCLDGLDVASEGELSESLALGYPGSKLSLAGPSKPKATLELALTAGAWISIESLGELERLSGLRSFPRAKTMLRINPEVPDLAYPLRIGGSASPFGIDEARAGEAVETARRLGVDLKGVHVYAGAQARSARGVARAVLRTLELGARLKRELPVQRVGLGGGFGIAERQGESELSVEGVARAMDRRRLDEALQTLDGAEVALELGRYLAGPAGCYVAKVIDVRESRGHHFTVLDGGMNHLLFATPIFGPDRPRRAIGFSERPARRTHLIGPLCTPLDVLAEDVELPELREGDLVVVPSAGAYGLTASPVLFLGHTTPLELLRTEHGTMISRERTRPFDLGRPGAKTPSA